MRDLDWKRTFDDLELALRLIEREFHAGGISGGAEAAAAIRRCMLRLTAGQGEAEDGPDSTREPSRRASSCGLCARGLFHYPNSFCRQ